MKKRKLLSVEEINKLNAEISEKWTLAADREINEQTRQKKISLARKGLKAGPMSEQHKRKIALAQTGKAVSEETKEKKRKSASTRKEIVIDNVRYLSYGEAAAAFGVSRNIIRERVSDGRPLTAEILTKIGNKEREPFSDEHRRNLSLSHKGQRSPRSKAVSIQGVVYHSAREAARQLGVDRATVGSRVHSTAKEWKDWFFVDEKSPA